jgi:hypothetical protein
LDFELDFQRFSFLLHLAVQSTSSEYRRYRIIMPGRTAEPTDRFQTLVQALSDKLGPCSGINSDDVDEKELQRLMEDYVSDESEWKKYSMVQPGTAYTRNLVDKGNGKSNLVPIVLSFHSWTLLTLVASTSLGAW